MNWLYGLLEKIFGWGSPRQADRKTEHPESTVDFVPPMADYELRSTPAVREFRVFGRSDRTEVLRSPVVPKFGDVHRFQGIDHVPAAYDVSIEAHRWNSSVWRVTVAYRPRHGLDDPEWDGTIAAHPAWWRGNDRAVAVLCREINAILDHAEMPRGMCQEPWESTRRRICLLASKAKKEDVRPAVDMDLLNDLSFDKGSLDVV